MDKRAFFRLVARWHGEPADNGTDGLYTRTGFYVARDGAAQLVREVHEISTLEGKKIQVRCTVLRCGHSAADAQEVVAVGDEYYCRECVHPCPECGEWIVPGSGVQVEGVWFHKTGCADSPREHFEVKRLLAEGMEAAKLLNAFLQGRLTEAQVKNIYHSMRIQDERLELDKKREEEQRALIAAQRHGIYENLRLQEERFGFDKEQGRKSLEQKERVLDSQLESEHLNRLMSKGRFRLEALERMKKLEEQGHLPWRERKKVLP